MARSWGKGTPSRSFWPHIVVKIMRHLECNRGVFADRMPPGLVVRMDVTSDVWSWVARGAHPQGIEYRPNIQVNCYPVILARRFSTQHS